MRLTVKDLIEALQKFPPDAEWNGWDDESIIIRDPNTRDEGYIHPEGDIKLLPRD